MRTGKIGVDERESGIGTDIRTKPQPPSTARPEPPDAFVSLHPEFGFQDVQRLRGFELLEVVAVVKPVEAGPESLQFKELKTGGRIVFAVFSVWTLDKLFARTIVARSSRNFSGRFVVLAVLAAFAALRKRSVKLWRTN